LNRESERIIKKTASLTVEDPCSLLQGSSIYQRSPAPSFTPENGHQLPVMGYRAPDASMRAIRGIGRSLSQGIVHTK